MALINKKRKMSVREERSIDEFELLSKIGEGAYGVVYKARDKQTRETVAVKKVKSSADADAEASILGRLKHRSIIGLRHGGGGGNFLVMEYAENDVRWLLERTRRPFSQSDVKCLMQQLLQGVEHMHRNQVLHRDLKTSNLLLNNRGELKICDLGLACRFDKVQHREKVVSLWYRAPELLLGAEAYSTGVDMWSVGCVMAELLSGELLFDGTSEMDQLGKIYKLLGNPNSKQKQGKGRRNPLRDKFPAVSFIGSPVLSAAGFDLLTGLLAYDPHKRMSAEKAVDHPWFREVPLPKSKDFMPTFPERMREQSQLQSGTGLFGF